MATRFGREYCDDCEEHTRHKIEYNRETGWRRERCMPCWNRRTENTTDADADTEADA